MTRIDSLLRLKLGMRWQVMCFRLPRRLPGNVTVSRIPFGTREQWEYRLTVDDCAEYQTLVARLRAERQIFSATIIDRPGRLASLVNRPGSRVMDAAWMIAMLGCAGVGLHFLPL